LSAFLTFNVQAACTYSEAVMAFNSGNLVRGQALMKMAARDGDQRAVRFLASSDENIRQEKGKAMSELLLVMDSLKTAQSTAEKVN
jgi:hypothetical protein